MFLKETLSGQKLEAVIELLDKKDFKVLGLIILIGMNIIMRKFINYVSNDNIGRKKKLDHIAGSLIAFASRESFKRGYDGCGFIIPKTNFVQHYRSKYGFHYLLLKNLQRPLGLMILYKDGAGKMIKKYLDY